MEIIVIGAGLAGLTVAIALQQAGHHVTVLESAPQITYIGAGIQISPNASRVLQKIGVEPHIVKYCTEPVDLRMMRWKTGEVLVECPLKQPAQEEYKSPYWHIHRADFHRGLVARAQEVGVAVHLDRRITKVEPEIPRLTTKGGMTYTPDLVVASDGLHSMCREVVLGEKSPPNPTGQMVYRVTLPAKKLAGIPGLEELATVPRNNHWLGPHATILSYLLEGVEQPLINFVFTCDSTMDEGVDTKHEGNEEVRERFKDWDPRLGAMLEHVQKVLKWRLFTHHELPHWAHPANKVVLIGDAAHAMTPYLAQGAAMGIEDAAVLAGILAEPDFATVDKLPESLKLYENIRIKRAARIAEASITSRYFTQMVDGPDQEARDQWMREHPGIWERHINIRSRKEFLDELFGYDVYAVLREALAKARKEGVDAVTAQVGTASVSAIPATW